MSISTRTDALDKFEERLVTYGRLEFPIGPDVENKSFPPMATIYKDLILPGDLPPPQTAFARRVMLDADHADPKFLPPQGVYARAANKYPSFVRQHHFSVALRERTQLEGVYWQDSLDFRGLDILVLHRGFAIGIDLSLATDKAAFWKTIKANRHSEPVRGLEIIRLDVKPRTYQIGDYWLHPPSDIKIIVTAMARHVVDQRTGAIPTLSEAEAIYNSLKKSGKIRSKAGFSTDVRPFWEELIPLMRRRAWSLKPAETSPELDIEDVQ